MVGIIIVASVASLFGFMFSDWFNVTLRRLFGQKGIYVRDRDNYWISNIREDPWGKKFCYRYTCTRIGFVELFDDGTGNYYGKVEWKPM